MRALSLTIVICGLAAGLHWVSSDVPLDDPFQEREEAEVEHAMAGHGTLAPRRFPEVDVDPDLRVAGAEAVTSSETSVDDVVARFDGLLAELGRLHREKVGMRSRPAADREERRKGRRARRELGDELTRIRHELLQMLDVDPGLAPRIVAALDRMPDDEGVIAFGSFLARTRDSQTVEALKTRAVGAATPVQRRTALRGMVGRDASVWYEAASTLFREDPDTAVRDESVAFLGGTLADPLHRESHDRVRRLLATGLEDADPLQRRRALRGFVFDRSGSPVTLEAVKAAHEDEDGDVRAEAARVLRVIERR